jgi:hypothetical protein
MNISKSDKFYCKNKTKIGFTKLFAMSFVIFVSLIVMPIYTENALSQTTLFTCNTSNGIGSSAMNCFTNSSAAKINPIAPKTNQTAIAPVINQTAK